MDSSEDLPERARSAASHWLRVVSSVGAVSMVAAIAVVVRTPLLGSTAQCWLPNGNLYDFPSPFPSSATCSGTYCDYYEAVDGENTLIHCFNPEWGSYEWTETYDGSSSSYEGCYDCNGEWDDSGHWDTNSMKNCTYPNASWWSPNSMGKTPGTIGEDVFCSADYVDCYLVESGFEIPNDVVNNEVSLGMPSNCDEGWVSGSSGGSSGGSTGGSSGGSSGGDGGSWSSWSSSSPSDSPIELCVQGCGGRDNECYERYCRPMADSSSSSSVTSTSSSSSSSSSSYSSSSRYNDSDIRCWRESDGSDYPIPEDTPSNATCGVDYCTWTQTFDGVEDTVRCEDHRYSGGSSSWSDGGYPDGPYHDSGSMQNCTYSRSEWKWRNTMGKPDGPVGKKIFCKWDYMDCHIIDDGTPIPNPGQNVMLGAADTCDGGDDPWSGGGQSSSWSSSWSSWNSSEWGDDTGGGLEGGYGGDSGGVFGQDSSLKNCVYKRAVWWEGNSLGMTPGPIGEDVFCREDYVDCETVDSGMKIPNVWQDVSLGGPETCEEGWDGGGSDGGYGGSFGGGYEGDFDSRKREVRRMLNSMMEHTEEMRRVAGDRDVDISSALVPFVTALTSGLQCVEQATDGVTLDPCMDDRELGNFSDAVWQLLNAEGGRSIEQELDEFRLGPMRNMEDMIARMHEDEDTRIFDDLLRDIRSILADAKTASSEEGRGMIQHAYEMQAEFWKKLEKHNERIMEEDHRGNLQDACDRIGAESGRQSQSIATRLDNLKLRCQKVVANLQAKGANRQESEDAMRALWQDFERIMDSVWGDQSCREAERTVAEADSAITGDALRMIADIRGKDAAAAEELTAHLERAKNILKRSREALAKDDCQKALAIMSTDMENIRIAFESTFERVIGRSADVHEREVTFVNNNRHYEAIYKRVYEEEQEDDTTDDGEKKEKKTKRSVKPNYEAFTKHLKDRGYKAQELVLIQQMDPMVVADFIAAPKPLTGRDVLRVAAEIDLSAREVEEIIAVKKELEERIEKIEEERHEKAKVFEEIQSYTFHPSLSSEVAKVIGRTEHASADELEGDLSLLIEQSRRKNVETGVAAFEDVDPFDPQHEWFVRSVQAVVHEGIFRGVEEGQFAPHQEANIAQLITTLSRVMNRDSASESPTSAMGSRMPDWAKGPAAGIETALQAQGTSLDALLPSGEPGAPAKRIEVARLFVALFGPGLPPANTDLLQNYGDLGGLSSEDREAVSQIIAAGIMTGTGIEWNPQGTFNRAQFAAVIHRLIGSGIEADSAGDGGGGSGGSGALPSEVEQPAAPEPYRGREEEKIDVGFDMHGVLQSEFTIIKSIISNWVSEHGSGERAQYSKLKRALDQAEETYVSKSNQFYRMDLENHLMEHYDTLKEVLKAYTEKEEE